MTITKERAVAALSRYLRLCDEPSPERSPAALAALWTEDAVWEGTGTEYARRFGRTEGRAEIAAMLLGYRPQEGDLTCNIHLLFPGEVEISGETACGSWPMQQLSSFADGHNQLMIARLDVEFRSVGPKTLISRFGTCRLFATELSS